MQSMINSSTAEGYHRYKVLGNGRLSRLQAGDGSSGPRRDVSLFSWFEAHSRLVTTIGLVACLLFYGLTVVYGVVAGGHWQPLRESVAGVVNKAAIAAGFEVKAVQVEGRRNMTQAEIAAALGSYQGQSIFAFDTAAARKTLKANGWTDEARVMRLLPSTLIVEIEEREPFALWREGGKTAVIDAEGTVLSLAGRDRFPELPMVSGPGAASPARDIIEALGRVPRLRAHVQDIVRIAGRRWDLMLDTGLRVKLPSTEFAGALTDLAVIARKNPAAFYEMSEMDFRVPSQFTVRLKDESQKGRRRFLSWLSKGGESHSQGL